MPGIRAVRIGVKQLLGTTRTRQLQFAGGREIDFGDAELAEQVHVVEIGDGRIDPTGDSEGAQTIDHGARRGHVIVGPIE